MSLPAMARVTKIPQQKLEALSRSSPVFAPGVTNYLKMGGLEALWEGELAGRLASALRESPSGDRRRELGEQRGGRQQARAVAQRVRTDEIN
jgi:malonate decarboxylase gamma subunit